MAPAKPPGTASGKANPQTVAALLRPLHPQLRVHRTGRTALVSVNAVAIAQVGSVMTRLLPDGEWESLHLSSPADRARIRQRVAAEIARRERAETDGLSVLPNTTSARKSWLGALLDEGVPATIGPGGAVVALGRVVREPSNVASPRRPARRYVEEQTLRAFQTLPKRVNRAIGSRSDCNVAWGTDRVTVAVRGEPVAEINRFVVSVRGNRLWAGDVLGDPAALRAIRAGLADFAGSPPALGDGPSARSDPSRNESERPFAQGEPAPIDERDDRDAVPARVAWPGGVVAFFEAAGMSAHVVAGGVWLEEGHVHKPTAATLADDERLRAWLDGRIEAHASQALYRRVRSHLAESPMLQACRRTDRVDIFAPDKSVVLHITATMAWWPDGQSVDGNFLADGEWWAPVHQQISESTAEWSSSGLARRGIHREFPLDASPELRANAVEASRRLRETRARAFEHTIRIDIEDAELEFLPVVLVGRQAFVPFRLDDNETLFTGAIGLGQSGTVAPCRWDQWSETETLAAAWALGLTVYADLTCAQDPSERESLPLRASNRRSTGRTGRGADRSDGRRATLRLGSDHSRIPARFAPCEATARYLAAYVAGHVRRLQPGHEHSSQAVANAARYGIRLRSGETWVQPHTRGVPSDAILRFAWHAPTRVLTHVRC